MPGPKLAVDIHADASDLLSIPISFSNNNDNIIIAGVPQQIIRVWKLWFIVGGTTNIEFKDGANLISGLTPFSSNEGMVLDFDTKPWVTCGAGNAFIMNQDGGVRIGGMVYFTQG